MPDRLQIHVVPESHETSDGEDSFVFRWRVEIAGETEHRYHSLTKYEALRYARTKARRRLARGSYSEVYEHDRRGTIRDRSTFGADPRETVG